ncbi:hypothetical protein DTL42_24285 [Bremerella cremea]|uniref:Glycosyltransferase RgtA/B/C/D-like domain-containing protein n=1 Tax=Bremerella cremea TaxID=1031537 RepID=A0A368KIV1_9BACT|nr:hypothetical protein [Bremerella cremea]RCS40496.1 hypothetical protein DTL42_24285 [Bremerella cremea]
MDSPSNPPTDSSRGTSVWLDWQWYAVLLIALLIRGGLGYVQLDSLQDDPDSYRKLAQNIRLIHSFTFHDPAEPTAFRPPLYPLLLAVTSPSQDALPMEVLVLHVALGLITVGLTFYWARCLGLARWRSLAALLVAVDPILLNQATLVMTETLATCLAILALVAISSLATTAEEEDKEKFSSNLTIRAANVAGAVALAIYCRPTFLVWAALLPLAIAVGLKTWKHRGIAIAAYGLMLIFLLSPWVARNWLVFEAPVLGTTHGGHTLLWGNNESYYEYLRSGTTLVWENDAFHEGFNQRHPYQHTSASELARDRSAYAEAAASMRANPAMAAYSCLVRLSMFWRPLPHALSAEESPKLTALRYAIGAWYSLQFALVLVGLVTLGRKLMQPSWLAGLLLMASFTLVHLFFWSNMRMRSPLVPVLVVLACAGIDWIFRSLWKR